MERELLIIKSSSDYIRVKDGQYLLCGLDKASVFTMDRLQEVKEHMQNIRDKKSLSPSLFKLLLREEELQDL